jgi:hypothetical protein
MGRSAPRYGFQRMVGFLEQGEEELVGRRRKIRQRGKKLTDETGRWRLWKRPRKRLWKRRL